MKDSNRERRTELYTTELDEVLWCVRGLNLSPTASGRERGAAQKTAFSRHDRRASDDLDALSCVHQLISPIMTHLYIQDSIKSPASFEVAPCYPSSTRSVLFKMPCTTRVSIDRPVTPRRVARTPACPAVRWMLQGNHHTLPICSFRMAF